MDLSNRLTQLNDCPGNRKARYVLYWMQMFKRTSHNHALNFAIEMANDRRLPLVVYEGLKYYYPWANDRLHTFILEGVPEKTEEFARLGIRYIFYLQRKASDSKNTLTRLAKNAALLVTDDFPCFIIPEHNRCIAASVNIPVFAVDSNGMIPLSAFHKEEYAARTIRPKIRKLLPQYLAPIATPRLKCKAPTLATDCPETAVIVENIPRLVSQCDIDHTVKPSPLYQGGTMVARKRLNDFVRAILPRYNETRNEPSVDGTSRLSAYLHFGFISIQEIAAAVNQSKAPEEAKAAYLEEAIVRRELSFNFTRFNAKYDSLAALPTWALKTMREHSGDARQEIYAPEQIEAGQTGDELWNAAQRELIHTGEMHNYVRMLWGKRVIEWQPSYEGAFALLEHLNNKYALDGRDPNSYAGILWCFGKHDRAWGPERPIFGKLRYMTSRSMSRKFDAKAYIAWTRAADKERTRLVRPQVKPLLN
jgi:deoxyribodipyrimidine photo-lyase